LLFGKKKIAFDENDLTSVINACIENDAKAQRVLFKQFFGYAKSICLRYAPDEYEAEDILNEGFLKVFQHLEKFDTSQPFKAWLRTILVNTAISHYRKNKKYDQEVSYDDVGVNNPHIGFNDTVFEQISAQEILAIVQKLPNAYRTAFVMHAIDGYEYAEIASQLGVVESSVRSNVARARVKLQEMIRSAYPQYFSKNMNVSTFRYNEN
jgi:RNA polymerase sigma-70 factor, ECF subfamily